MGYEQTAEGGWQCSEGFVGVEAQFVDFLGVFFRWFLNVFDGLLLIPFFLWCFFCLFACFL